MVQESVLYDLTDASNDFLSCGYYFKALNHDYVIQISDVLIGVHCKLKIFSAPCLQDDRNLPNFQPVKFGGMDFNHELTIDVWGKHYFIKYEQPNANGYQLYHNDNGIDAQFIVLKSALEFGIKQGEIILY